MSAKRSFSDSIITRNVTGLSLEQIDMGIPISNDEEKLRDLKRPRLMTYYDEDLEDCTTELEKNLCLSCSIL